MDNDFHSSCKRLDCQLNHMGKCLGIKKITVLRNGTKHKLDQEHCPFYKKRIKR